jgi:hypothetical protein
MSLSMLEVTSYPIYLPNDTVPVPFGQPLAVTVTDASPGVFTAVGYAPVNGDLVSFSAAAGVALPTGLTVGTIYYVVSASNDTFEISATSGGSAITISGTLSAVLHIINSAQPVVDLPFKPGYTVLALNLGSTGSTLQGAPDTNVGNTTGNNVSGYPAGPSSSWTTMATIAGNSMALVELAYDWIRVGSGDSLYLLQV